jgi:hypothetical protein
VDDRRGERNGARATEGIGISGLGASLHIGAVRGSLRDRFAENVKNMELNKTETVLG